MRARVGSMVVVVAAVLTMAACKSSTADGGSRTTVSSGSTVPPTTEAAAPSSASSAAAPSSTVAGAAGAAIDAGLVALTKRVSGGREPDADGSTCAVERTKTLKVPTDAATRALDDIAMIPILRVVVVCHQKAMIEHVTAQMAAAGVDAATAAPAADIVVRMMVASNELLQWYASGKPLDDNPRVKANVTPADAKKFCNTCADAVLAAVPAFLAAHPPLDQQV